MNQEVIEEDPEGERDSAVSRPSASAFDLDLKPQQTIFKNINAGTLNHQPHLSKGTSQGSESQYNEGSSVYNSNVLARDVF
jgi:hypothetical protein